MNNILWRIPTGLLEIFKLMCKLGGYIPTEKAIGNCASVFEKKCERDYVIVEEEEYFMQELHRLMDYIDCYRYDKKEEKIVIVHSPHDEVAKEIYDNACRTCNKWHLDIAIDCVREISDNDRDYILRHMNSSEYHFSYAMAIRNEYIHCSKNHFILLPDEESTQVMKVIFSIIHPYYNFDDKNCTDYYESGDYFSLSNNYGDEHRDVFEVVEEQLFDPDGGLAADEALKLLMVNLAEKVDKKDFKKEFLKFMKGCYEKGWASKEDDIVWHLRLLDRTRLFPLQANQAFCLKALGLFDSIRSREIRSQEQCKQFIDVNLSLDENSALFMAECIWEACNPDNEIE